KMLATVTMARGAAAAHLVSFNPAGGLAPDYVICFQCGFIVRLFANPPLERFDFVGSRSARSQLLDAVRANPEIPKLNLPPERIEQYTNHLFDGLLTQFRSVPVGLRVDAWLATEYPELRDLQCAYALRQLQDNQQVLSADVRRHSVEPAYGAS